MVQNLDGKGEPMEKGIFIDYIRKKLQEMSINQRK